MKVVLLSIFTLMSLGAVAQTSLELRDSLFLNSDFRGRIRSAVIEAASDILANPADSLQHGFAGRILLEPRSEYFIDAFTAAALTNPVITGESIDNDIKFAVNSQFAKLATQYRRQRNEGEFAEE